MNVSLPDALKEFVDAQVQERGYSTSSEYIRDLIRSDQVKQAEQGLVALLREGLASGTPMPTDESYWNKKRAALRERFSPQ
jgi:antitoxin ParD1/3/4